MNCMPVRCTHCGYENDPQYRFCGMCGVALPQATPAGTSPPPESRPPGISGPSFLGLAENPQRDVEYLLEEEPPSGHWRMYLALALLIVSAGLLVWHWQRDGYPWAATAVTQSAPSAAGSVAAPAAEAPAPAEAPGTEAAPASHAVNTPEKIAVAEPPAESKSEAASPPADSQTKEPDSAQSGNSTPTEPGSKAEDTTAAAAQAAPAETAAAPPPAVPEPAEVEPPAVAPVVSYTDKLVADGEKYLYGNGVPEDCSRAQKNLLSAAKRSSVKAESMLATMYTTGHCVARDLPTAYHWFALALRHDPGNKRIEQDLEVVWKQMTLGEKQVALRNRQ
jgi:hypothetical protein